LSPSSVSNSAVRTKPETEYPYGSFEPTRPSAIPRYKHTRIKQYHKAGRALRTETTINDASDFELRKGLSPRAALRKVGFQANRRLLDVQRISQDCAIGEAALARLPHPVRTCAGATRTGAALHRSRGPGAA
jgi:hypothetical protein